MFSSIYYEFFENILVLTTLKWVPTFSSIYYEFFENIFVLTTLKWVPTFSSIYYEQVALLHPPNRLVSDETQEFLPKHVPHV